VSLGRDSKKLRRPIWQDKGIPASLLNLLVYPVAEPLTTVRILESTGLSKSRYFASDF
jgi:hypothetical protein